MSSSDRKSNMSVCVTNATRSALIVMIEREEKRLGSREVAYGAVAKTVGASSSWVKKFVLKISEAKEPRITLFMNIRAAYENVCNRVEQENRNDEMRLRLLKGEMNAVTAGFAPKGED